MSSRAGSVGVGLISLIGVLGLIGAIGLIGWSVKAQLGQELRDIGVIGRAGAGIGLVA
jgi:hypothetical protein